MQSSAVAPEVNLEVIVENIHFSDSLLALGYYLSERMDSEAAAAAKNQN